MVVPSYARFARMLTKAPADSLSSVSPYVGLATKPMVRLGTNVLDAVLTNFAWALTESRLVAPLSYALTNRLTDGRRDRMLSVVVLHAAGETCQPCVVRVQS